MKLWGVTNAGCVRWHLKQKNYPLSKNGRSATEGQNFRPRKATNVTERRCISVPAGLKRASISTFICSGFVSFPADSDWVMRPQTESKPRIRYKTVCHIVPQTVSVPSAVNQTWTDSLKLMQRLTVSDALFMLYGSCMITTNRIKRC